MSKPPASLWRALEEFPPYYVRLLAKRPGSGLQDMALTDTDIAIKSGISLDRVRAINRMLNWHECTVAEVLNFTLACGIDPANPRDRAKHFQYLYVCKKRHSKPFQWLKLSPRYESELLPLIRLLRPILSPNSQSSPISASAK